MKKILIVTTHTDIEDRFKVMVEKNILPEGEYSVIAEFYGVEPPKETIFSNFSPIIDLESEDEINEMIEKCKLWGPFDYILQTDEYAIYLAAKICEGLDFPGMPVEDAIKFRDKVVMKKALKGNIRSPHMYTLEEVLKDESLFPVVIKPRSYAASKGVSIVNSVNEMKNFIENNNITVNYEDEVFKEFSLDNVEIEEYIDGPVFHLDGLIYNNELLFCKASEYIGTCLDYLNGNPLASILVDNNEEQNLWTEFAINTHSELKLPNGAFHLEAFKNKKGERIFLEVAVRPGGAAIVDTIEKAYGVNLDNAHIQCQLGKCPEIDTTINNVFGWLIFPKGSNPETAEIVKRVEFPKSEVKSIISSKIPEIGENYSGSFSYMNNLGIFIFKSKNRKDIESDIKILLDKYKVYKEKISLQV